MEFQQYAAAEAVRESRDLLETLLAGTRPRAAAARRGPGARARAGHPHAVARGDRGRCSRGSRFGGSRAHGPRPGRRRPARGLRGDRQDRRERHEDPVGRTAVGDRRHPRRSAPAATPSELCDRLQAVRESLLGEGIVLAMGISTVIAGTRPDPAGLPGGPRGAGVPAGGRRRGRAPPGSPPFQYLALRADDTARHLVDPADHRAAGRGPGARRRAHRHDPRLRRRRPEPARLPPSGCRSTPTPPSTGCAASRSAPDAACAGSTTSSTCSWPSRCRTRCRRAPIRERKRLATVTDEDHGMPDVRSLP